MDNIGGVNECGYLFQTDTKQCAPMNDNIIVLPNSGKDWNLFNEVPSRTEINIDPVEGTNNYTVDISVYIATGKLNYTQQLQLKKRKLLFRYKSNQQMVFFVAGDKENPLTATVTELTPADASGFSGLKISMKGTVKHGQLPLL